MELHEGWLEREQHTSVQFERVHDVIRLLLEQKIPPPQVLHFETFEMGRDRDVLRVLVALDILKCYQWGPAIVYCIDWERQEKLREMYKKPNS